MAYPKSNRPDPSKLKTVSSSGSTSVEGAVSADSLRVGLNVMHEKFGKGEILAIDGEEPNAKATILFQKGLKKQLLLRFAKLTVIN
ncbi:MAG TPA: hypothetical protein VK177_09255 [Flavobacteriales bacterium]|nr:hypothetical protein [Flavobacteriales bacterium]